AEEGGGRGRADQRVCHHARRRIDEQEAAAALEQGASDFNVVRDKVIQARLEACEGRFGRAEPKLDLQKAEENEEKEGEEAGSAPARPGSERSWSCPRP